MLQIPVGIGGYIRWRAPVRPDASPTVQVLDAGGGERVAAATAATLHSVNTTLSGAVAAGASTMTVASATGIVAGEEYLVGTADRPTDFVKVKSIASTTLTLQHPTLHAYGNGVAFVGTYIDYYLDSDVATDPYEDWQARFSWADNSIPQAPGIVRLDIVRYAPAPTTPLTAASPFFTLNDVRLIEPKVTDKVADTFDYEWAFAQARNDACRDINASLKSGGVVQDDDLRWIAVYRFLAEYAAPLLGERYERTQKQWRERYESKLSTLKAQMSVDENQNLAISAHEHGFLGGRTYRA